MADKFPGITVPKNLNKKISVLFSTKFKSITTVKLTEIVD